MDRTLKFFASLVLCALALNAGAQTAVLFPLAQMTGTTNDTTITIKPVNNPVKWNHTIAWFPTAGIQLKTTNGSATTNLIPNDYTVTIAGIPGSWRISVNDTNVTLNAADIGNLTTYSFTDLFGYVKKILPGTGYTVSPASGQGNVTLNITGGGGGGSATNAYQLQISGALLSLTTNVTTFVYTLAGVPQTNANMALWGATAPNTYSNQFDLAGSWVTASPYAVSLSNKWNSGSNDLNTAIAGKLASANNLSDVANRLTALATLGGISTNYTLIWTNGGIYSSNNFGWILVRADGSGIQSNTATASARLWDTNGFMVWKSNNVVNLTITASGDVIAINSVANRGRAIFGTLTVNDITNGVPDSPATMHGDWNVTGQMNVVGKFSAPGGIDATGAAVAADSFSGDGFGLSDLDASDITGVIPPANLGTGTSISGKFLRGDGTFQTISGGGDMIAANNLSDVASAPTALGNIGGAASATTLAIAGTGNQIASSAGAQSLGANRTWTLSLSSTLVLPGTLNVPGNQTNQGAFSLTGPQTNFGSIYIEAAIPATGHTNVLFVEPTGKVTTNDVNFFVNTNQSPTILGSPTGIIAAFDSSGNIVGTNNGMGLTNMDTHFTNYGAVTNIVLPADGNKWVCLVTNGPHNFLNFGGPNMGAVSVWITTNGDVQWPPQFTSLGYSNHLTTNCLFDFQPWGGTNRGITGQSEF